MATKMAHIRLDLEQSTPDWLQWRRNYIGASDAPAIMGLSPYKEAYDVWLEKKGLSESIDNPAMQYGREREPKIREWYEEKMGEWFPPQVIVNPQHDWMMASLDGVSGDGKRIIEIKTCSRKTFADVRRHNLRDDHAIQAQHQMACAGVDHIHFVYFCDGEYAEIDCLRNNVLIDQIIDVELKFVRDHIRTNVPPQSTQACYVSMQDEPDWMLAEERAREVYPRLKALEKEWEHLRSLFLSLSQGNGKSQGGCVRVSTTYNKGSIDYERMRADGIDIDKYRKPMQSKDTVTYIKGNP